MLDRAFRTSPLMSHPFIIRCVFHHCPRSTRRSSRNAHMLIVRFAQMSKQSNKRCVLRIGCVEKTSRNYKDWCPADIPKAMSNVLRNRVYGKLISAFRLPTMLDNNMLLRIYLIVTYLRWNLISRKCNAHISRVSNLVNWPKNIYKKELNFEKIVKILICIIKQDDIDSD